MSFNTSPYNTRTYNSGIVATGAGTLVGVEQDVAIVGSGALVNVEQIVALLETGSGALVNVDQAIEATGSGILVNVAQKVIGPTQTNSLAARKYRISAFIGGLDISDDLTDTMEVSFEEGTAALCKLVLYTGLGVQNLEQYFGQTLIVTGAGTDGVDYRMFTGVIDIVDFDVINSKTTLQATDRRKELIEAISSPRDKFGSANDTRFLINQELEGSDLVDALLPYAPFSLDFDAYNNFTYTSWTPKSTADITLNNADVFRREPIIELVTRGRIINQVQVEVNYEFTRLQYVQVSYGWDAPYDSSGTSFNLVLQNGYSLTRKDTIAAAIDGTGWPINGQVTFADLPPPGWYDGVGWVGDIKQTTTNSVRDANGDKVTDSNGNTVYASSTRREYNSSSDGIHATSADFILTNRWSQQAIKSYTLTINAPTSQTVFGVLDRKSSYTIVDEYDSTRWDDYQGYTSSFDVEDGTTLTLNSSQTHNVVPQEPIAESNIQAALDKARTEILKTHRENLVTAQTQFLPSIQMHHTVELSTNRIQTKGKVKSYRHRIDFQRTDSETEFELAFYFLGSGSSDDTRTLPTITVSNPVSFPGARVLESNYGVDPEASGFLKLDGFFGNRWPAGSFFRTTFTEQFRIDTPAVPAELVSGLQYAASSSYNIEIPSGTLVITYVK